MKKPPKTPATETQADAAALFRSTVGAVTPLAEPSRIMPNPPTRKPYLPAPAQATTVPDTLSDTANDTVLSEFMREGISRMALRKLRRGTIQDQLDLHGLHMDAARKLLQEFIHAAYQRKLHHLLLIHGKGINSLGGEAVLRKQSRYWLVQLPQVLGFCDAPPNRGGSGATLILLKS